METDLEIFVMLLERAGIQYSRRPVPVRGRRPVIHILVPNRPGFRDADAAQCSVWVFNTDGKLLETGAYN